VLVSCDLPFASPDLIQIVRERVAERAPNLPPERVVLHCTHTHTAPVVEDGFYDYPGGDVMSPSECLEWIAAHAVEVVVEAWGARRPRVLGRAFGHAVVGHNRHAVYADGHAQMYGKTNREDFIGFGGYEDHSLDMIFFWEPDGALSGLALAIPCPSQVTEGLSQWSADFWHDIRVELRARLGEQLQVLPICSAAGDQSPHFLLYGPQEEEMRNRRGVTERREIALRVADAVMRALDCTQPEPERQWPLAHLSERLILTPRQISREERDWAESAAEEAEAKGDTHSWWPTRLRRVVEYHDGLREAKPVPAEVHVIRLGDMALATNPFELFIDFGLRIKARSPAAQTVLVQLAGRGMYLPTERGVAGGGYGAMPAVSPVGPEGGAELVEATLALIGRHFPV